MNVELFGLRFTPVTIADRPRLSALLTRFPQPLSDYTFPSLLVWGPPCGYHYAIAEPDTLLVLAGCTESCQPILLQPVGEFPAALQETLLRHAAALRAPLRIQAASEEFLRRHAAFAAHFEIAEARDGANYIYAASDLAELRGRHYAGKRNLIAQAARTYAWTVEPLDHEHIADCLEISDDIARKRSADSAVTLAQETEALAHALRLFAELGLAGLLLRVEGRPAAFSIYDRLNPTTAVILFERALRSYKGLYQVINQETARVLSRQGFTLLNREEDLGDAGLRKAKLSYLPTRLEMKHTLTLRR
jgi:hypothetical protein